MPQKEVFYFAVRFLSLTGRICMVSVAFSSIPMELTNYLWAMLVGQPKDGHFPISSAVHVGLESLFSVSVALGWNSYWKQFIWLKIINKIPTISPYLYKILLLNSVFRDNWESALFGVCSSMDFMQLHHGFNFAWDMTNCLLKKNLYWWFSFCLPFAQWNRYNLDKRNVFI